MKMTHTSHHTINNSNLQTTWGYNDLFSHTWKVFSDYPVTFLNQYEGKKVTIILEYYEIWKMNRIVDIDK